MYMTETVIQDFVLTNINFEEINGFLLVYFKARLNSFEKVKKDFLINLILRDLS